MSMCPTGNADYVECNQACRVGDQEATARKLYAGKPDWSKLATVTP